MELSDGSVFVSVKTDRPAEFWISWPGGTAKGSTWDEARERQMEAGFFETPGSENVKKTVVPLLKKAAVFLSGSSPGLGQVFRVRSSGRTPSRGDVLLEISEVTRGSFRLCISTAALPTPFWKRLTPPPDGDRGKFLLSLVDMLVKDFSDTREAAVVSRVKSFERLRPIVDGLLKK